MITSEQAKEICNKKQLTDIECLEVVQRYIFDRKGVNVGMINRPTDILNLNLMRVAFEAASIYYLNN